MAEYCPDHRIHYLTESGECPVCEPGEGDE